MPVRANEVTTITDVANGDAAVSKRIDEEEGIIEGRRRRGGW